MAAQAAIRCLGHPGLRQVCANVNVDKFHHESIRTICHKLKDSMVHYAARSISAPQLGYKYRIFAMETVFYEDFHEEKADFEHLFLTQPNSDAELQEQTEAINSYLNQLEFHLNNHVPYEHDLKHIEQQFDQSYHSGQPLGAQIKPMIFINPTWTPLDLDQSIFEMEQNKGNVDGSGDKMEHNFTSNAMYTTLLFGCNGVRSSRNYEQCLSFPELMVKKTRYNRIRTEFYTENGEKKICYLKSHDARLFQHECDHLDGILMTDRVNFDKDVICVDEYLRRQQILKPQIEELIQKFGPSQQNELYQVYDPLHPPCDEELVEILESILQKKNQQQQMIIEQNKDPQNIKL